MRAKPIHLLSLVASGIILVSLLWLPDLDEVADLLSDASMAYLGLVLALYFANLIVKGYRWYLLLDTGPSISFGSTLPYYTVSLSINNLMPGRVAGEPFRLMFMRAADAYPVPRGLATIVWEKGVDMVVIILMAVLGIALVAGDLPQSTRLALLGVSALLLTATVVPMYLLVRRRLSAWFAPLLERIGRRMRSRFLEGKAPAHLRRFERAFDNLASRRLVAPTLALTVLIWANEVARFYIIYILVLPEGTWIDPGAILVAVTVATLLSIALPAGGGSLLGLNTVLLALSLPTDRVTAASLLSVATSIWLSFIVGAVVMTFIIYRHRGG